MAVGEDGEESEDRAQELGAANNRGNPLSMDWVSGKEQRSNEGCYRGSKQQGKREREGEGEGGEESLDVSLAGMRSPLQSDHQVDSI